MKKIISLLLSVIIFISAFEASGFVTFAAGDKASLLSEGAWQYAFDSSDNIIIKKYVGTDAKPVIPEKISGKTVTSVGCEAFYNTAIKQVTFPDTVTEIGWWAFYGCNSLSKVNFGKGIKIIGYGAFMNCTNLLSADIPLSISTIGKDAFAVSCNVSRNIYDYYSHRKISTQDYNVNSLFQVSGYSGTYAQKYAEDNGLVFNSKGTVYFGDADCSGAIDNKDTKLIYDYIEHNKKNLNNTADTIDANKPVFNDIQFRNSDVDDDGVITQKDIDLITDYLSNKISDKTFPTEKNLYGIPNYLYGKSMYCDGDSVAKGTGTDIMGYSFYSYCYYIAENYNMTVTNKAVGGTTIAKIKGKTNSILERVKKMNGSYDVVLLDGGFNDLFKKVELGTVTDDNNKSGKYNEYTTAGALESICYFLNKNYKESIKLFVLCHKRYANAEQDKYWNTIKQVLKKWDIDYIDLSEEIQLSDANDEISTQYFKFSDGVGDGIHPLRYTSEKIYGPYVAERLNEIASGRASLKLYENDAVLKYGEEYYIGVDYSDFAVQPELKWSSDNEKIAQVNEYGVVLPKGIGSTVIRACTADSKTAEIKIDVRLSSDAIKLKKTDFAVCTVLPKILLRNTHT